MFTLSFCSGGNIQALLSKEQLITPTSMERCLMNLIFHSSSVRLFPINVLLNPHAIMLALVQLKTCLCEKPLWDMTGVGTESLNWLGSWQSFNTSTGALADAFVKKKLCVEKRRVCVCARRRGESRVWGSMHFLYYNEIAAGGLQRVMPAHSAVCTPTLSS